MSSKNVSSVKATMKRGKQEGEKKFKALRRGRQTKKRQQSRKKGAKKS